MDKREYKWIDLNLMRRIVDAMYILACVAGINWVGEKTFKTSLSADPSSSLINFIKMAASVSASNMFLDYIDKKHII